MKLNKPKYWNIKNSFLSLLLFPVSLVVSIIIFIKKKLINARKFNIPIICVGNIYLGGTGKTPTSIYLARELSKLGKKPVILRKFYKSHSDEHNLIKANFNNLILDKNRINGIKQAEKKNYDCIILDDGFQDYEIHKNISIVCFNQSQLIGNGLILPSGPLRDSLDSLKNANIVLINGKKDEEFEKKILNINEELNIFYSNYKPTNLHEFKNKKLLAIAGIGNPENFFQLIKENNLNIQNQLIFPDHYEFTKIEIQKLKLEAESKDYQIIMTEKDYFKIKDFNIGQIGYLKVSLEIENKEKFINAITKVYDENN